MDYITCEYVLILKLLLDYKIRWKKLLLFFDWNAMFICENIQDGAHGKNREIYSNLNSVKKYEKCPKCHLPNLKFVDF